MNVWILIWRLNPPHIWHKKILEESLKNNNMTLLFLWSSNKNDINNPFSYEKRREFINEIFWENKKLKIDNLDDVLSDEEWILSIENKLDKYDFDRNINLIFYGWDFENDYAIIILKKYSNLLWFKNISFKEISRNSIKLIYNWKTVEISSTKVRESIQNKDKKLLEKLIDKRLINKIL